MSLMQRLARALGLDEAPKPEVQSTAFGELDAGPGGAAFGAGSGAPGVDGVAGVAGATAGTTGAAQTHRRDGTQVLNRYSALWQSVDAHLAAFMRHSVVPHRQYEPEDFFRLVRIQVAGTHPEAQAVLDGFLAEFRPDSRRRMVLTAIARTCPQGVLSDEFADFNRDFEQAELDEVDPYAAALSDAHQAGYQITLFGEWVHRPQASAGGSAASTGSASAHPMANAATASDAAAAASPPSQAAPPHAAQPRHPPVQLSIEDSRGTRQLQLSAWPFVLGRDNVNPEHAIIGTFVSRRHGLLDHDAEDQLWYRDTSVNGSLINGTVVQPGERRVLHDGAQLVLGGEGASAADCPRVRIDSGAGADTGARHGVTPLRLPPRAPGVPVGAQVGTQSGGHGGLPADTSAPPTPMLQPSQVATPMAGAATAAAPAPLCLLAVQDAQGSRTVAVTRLPYVIGRDEAADCCVPRANAGVSRQHLVIHAVDAQGAHISNHGAKPQRWGTEVGGAEQAEQFTLAWDAVATLAPRYAQAPSVRLQLLRAGR